MNPIHLDPAGVPDEPTFVLATRSASKLGRLLDTSEWKYHRQFNGPDEIFFDICRYEGQNENELWDKTKDFRLVWYRDVDTWFQIAVELDESDVSVKHITGTALCEAELSQVNVYDIEINTEDDIARDDYTTPTVFYDPVHPENSLLDRLLYKCPNYKIGHVDISLRNVQRKYSWSESSVYDALQDVATDIGCVIVYDSGTDLTHGGVSRTINAYDLQNYCRTCGRRFEGHDVVCPECGSTDIKAAYGDDSGIIVSRENLTQEIRLTSDQDATKNCFKLEAGDDVMTAAVRFATPDGSGYIWNITDDLREDMSDELSEKLADYDTLYAEYNDDHPYTIDSAGYNTLVDKYDPNYNNYSRIFAGAPKIYTDGSVASGSTTCTFDGAEVEPDSLIGYVFVFGTGTRKHTITANTATTITFTPATNGTVGNDRRISMVYSGFTRFADSDIILDNYPLLTEADYAVVDFYYYLHDSMMRGYVKPTYTADEQLGHLTAALRDGVSLVNLSASTSAATAETVIKSIGRHYIDTGTYNISVTTTGWSVNTSDLTAAWSGSIAITNRKDDADTATTGQLNNIAFSKDPEKYVGELMQSKIDALDYASADITELFGMNLTDFTNALKEFSLTALQGIYQCCQACVDLLIEQGCGNPEGAMIGGVEWEDAYTDIYQPYYEKLTAIQAAIDERAAEVAVIQQMLDDMETLISDTHTALDFEDYLGETLWLEFIPYRREDTYSNSNYISDGLSNSEIVANAEQFISVATKELYKSSVLQHSISATLHNLLVLPDFQHLTDRFDVGVWIRVIADDEPYVLRLLEYTIDWEDSSKIDVQFSDVDHWNTGYSDIRSVLESAQKMATSYGAVTRKADLGSTAAHWFDNGIDATLMNIVSDAKNETMSFDENGWTLKQYDDIIEDYSDEQLKILHNVLAFTDDNWQTVKAALGKIVVNDEEKYGLIAENIYGRFGQFVTLDADLLKVGKIQGQQNGNYNYWDLDSGKFKLATVSSDQGITYSNGMLNISADTITSGTLTGRAISGGSIAIGGTAANPNFSVDSNGNLIANSGTLTGLTIIGGSIAIGESGQSPNFVVTSAGNLTANNGVFNGILQTVSLTGAMNAAGGTIVGCELGVGGTATATDPSGGNFYVDDSGNVKAAGNLTSAGNLYINGNLTFGPNSTISWTNSGLATVATSGSYNDLSNKPSIPAGYDNSDVAAYLRNTYGIATQSGLTNIGSCYIYSPILAGDAVIGSTLQSVTGSDSTARSVTIGPSGSYGSSVEFKYGTHSVGTMYASSDGFGLQNSWGDITLSSINYVHISGTYGIAIGSASYGPLSQRPDQGMYAGQIYFATS